MGFYYMSMNSYDNSYGFLWKILWVPMNILWFLFEILWDPIEMSMGSYDKIKIEMPMVSYDKILCAPMELPTGSYAKSYGVL